MYQHRGDSMTEPQTTKRPDNGWYVHLYSCRMRCAGQNEVTGYGKTPEEAKRNALKKTQGTKL